MQAAYSQGAAGYVTRATGAFQVYSSNNNAGFGWVTDGVYDNNIPNGGAGGSTFELTTVWGINGFYQHFWNPKWRTSLYGGYVEVDYNANATNLINPHLPTPVTAPGIACGVAVEGAVAPPIAINSGAKATRARRTSAGGRSVRAPSGIRIRTSTSVSTCCGTTSTRRTRATLPRSARGGARPGAGPPSTTRMC